MSAIILEFPRVTEPSAVQAVIAGSVNAVDFFTALDRAGLIGRYDADSGVLTIEPEARNPAEALVG